jgi:uncharacterized protein (TIGR02611 family)
MFRTIGDTGSSIWGRGAALTSGKSAGERTDPGRSGGPARTRGVRAALRRNAVTRYLYQALVALLGAGVIAVGIVLLPLPGPGWVIIFLGLGVWASEFRWAARLLRWVRGALRYWTSWMGRRSPLVRTLLSALLALLVLAAVSASYIAWRGVPAWVPDWVPLLD